LIAGAIDGSHGSTTGRSGTSEERGNYNLGHPDFRPVIAGEANAPGSVYERLANPEHFTGVYKRAWFTDGRMNHFADTGMSLRATSFAGHTNAGSNETIHDIRHTLRTNSAKGKAFKP
jgi:hypothetical protein